MSRLNDARLNRDNGSGRTGAGRFAPGNPGGPGRPRRVAECDYLVAPTEECPPETWRAICRQAVKDALAGDARARDWLSRYLLGNPAELPTLGAATSPPGGPKHDDRN
jgi:hypothetical protein